jgi:AraC family transcriptional regulator, ethanolamine operon transcriptional activator
MGSDLSSRVRVVMAAERAFQGYPDAPVTMIALSHTVGVSARTLRYAFAQVRRESPKRYYLNMRLHSARAALSGQASEGTTVTRVATEYGFYELGRFASQYKALFGESPSRTLRRHRPSPVLSRTA